MTNKPVILITGSSRGIGAATAALAVAKGWQPILHGRTHSTSLEEIGRKLNAPTIFSDVGDQLAIQKAIQEAHKIYGKIDALVNTAGIVKPRPFLELTEENCADEYRTNVLGTIYACQAIIPLMEQQDEGGRIVNICSIRGLSPTSSFRGVNYSITKAAIANLTETLAKGYAPKIAVNAVAPGFTETDMAKTWNDQVWAQARSNLMQRPGTPTEIAEAILFLASPAAKFITGQTLLVDGGYSVAGK